MRTYVTLPNEDGLQLWLVHVMGSYYDNDPRGGGTVPVDARIFVVARNRAEALQKAQPEISKRDFGTEPEIIARPYPLEELVAARNSKHDGRMGYHSTTQVVEVGLTLSEDQTRYRLAVCLVDEQPR